MSARASRRAAILPAILILLSPIPGDSSVASDRLVDFDDARLQDLTAGCGGAAADWDLVRDTADPRDGFVRSRGVSGSTCLLVKGSLPGDGVVSARLRITKGSAGLAIRHKDADHYVGILIDPGAGRASAYAVGPRARTDLASAPAGPIPSGPIDATLALHGSRLALFLGGNRILSVAMPAHQGGEIGLLAGPRSIADFDDVEIQSSSGSPFPVVTPAVVPAATVGRSVELELRCLLHDETDAGGSSPCRFSLAGGSLPRGCRLESSGRIAGTPVAPGEDSFTVEARAADGTTARRALRMRVEGTRWPRFPLGPGSRVEPLLAVLYTPDDIGQNFNLAKIGMPDQALFLLHRDHPRIRVALMSCPANRYLGDRPLGDFPEVAALWRSVALGSPIDWLELGGHGYTHSPDGDTNLDHHEFSVGNAGCNVDHALMADPSYCRTHMALARAAYRAAGIPDDRVIVMRFPGAVDNPVALRAALDAGFLAFFGRRHPEEAGREWWVPAAGGGEILEIEDSHLQTVFARSEKLEEDLESGRLAPADVTSSEEFKAAVRRGGLYADRIAAGGGILNFSNHYWETFAEIGGARPRYLILDAVLRDIENRYAAKVWYPGARELALWLDARRNAGVSWRERRDGLHVAIEPPDSWERWAPAGLPAASLLVSLPAGWKDAGGVEIEDREGGWRPLDRAGYWMEREALAVTFPLNGRVEMRITRPRE